MKLFNKSYRRASSMIALTFALGLTAFVGCKDNDDLYEQPSYTLSPAIGEAGIKFSNAGGSQTYTLESNRRWVATTGDSWLNVSPSKGEAGKVTLTISALPNTGGARTGSIALSLGAKTQTISISQEASDNPTEPQFEGISLADFLKTYAQDTEVTISDDITFQAVVLSNVEQNNITSLKNIVVQAGSVGLSIRLNANASYRPGEILTFKPKGAKLSLYNGSRQLDFTGLTDGVTSTGNTQEVSPMNVTLADIYAGKYENVLVAVDGVQFVKYGQALYQGTASAHHNTLTDCATEPTDGKVRPLSVSISKYAKFKDQVASDKNGRIIGVLMTSTNKENTVRYYNLWPRTAEDIQLSAERCNTNDNTTPPTNPETPTPPTSGTTTLEQFLSTFDNGNATTISEDQIFEATVVTDVDANNFSGLKNVVVQQGNKGILLRFATDRRDLKAGQVLRINAKGATVQRYQGGGIQIDFSKVSDASNLVVATGQTQSISPIVVTLAELYTGKYENVLVTLKDVQLNSVENKTYNSKTKGSEYHVLEPQAGASAPEGFALPQLAVSSYAPFKGQNVASGNGNLTGILTLSIYQSKKQYSIWPRTTADIALSASRKGASNTPETTPLTNPTNPENTNPTPPASSGSPIIETYYEGKSMDKYIVIANPTSSPIDLSGYSLQMESYNSKHVASPSNNGVLDLSGKTLAAGEKLLIHNSKATNLPEIAQKLSNDKVANFNGDDNVALFKGQTIVDAVGTWGSAWLVGSKAAGADKKLVRKASIKQPNATYTDSEWDSSSI